MILAPAQPYTGGIGDRWCGTRESAQKFKLRHLRFRPALPLQFESWHWSRGVRVDGPRFALRVDALKRPGGSPSAMLPAPPRDTEVQATAC